MRYFPASVSAPLSVASGGTGSTSFSAGSVIFSNGTILTQANSDFNWDNALKQLNIRNHVSIDGYGASLPALASDEALRIWGGTAQTIKFVIDGSTSDGGRISFRQANAEGAYINYDNSSLHVGTSNSYDLVFDYSSGEIARISSLGLGIGTGAAPTNPLQVESSNSDYTNTLGAGAHILMTNAAGTQNVLMNTIGGLPISKWRSDNAGNISWCAYSPIAPTQYGIHYFWVNGDYADGGTNKVKITTTGTAIGSDVLGVTPASDLCVYGGLALGTTYAAGIDVAGDGHIITTGKLGFNTVAPSRSVTFNVPTSGADYFCFSHNNTEKFLLGYEQLFEHFVMYNYNTGVYQTVWDSGGVAIRTDGTGATAGLHIYNYGASAGSAGTAPIKLTTLGYMSTPEAGAIEWDNATAENLTWSPSTTRYRIPLINSGALTSGRVPFATTNGRLTDDSDFTFATDTLTVTKIAATTFTGNVTLSTKDIVTDTTTGTKFGTATTQKIGFFNSTPVVRQTDGAGLTNNVTAGGTTDTIADFTSLVVYATDAAAIRNDIYQLARKIKIVDDALRTYGLLS